MTVRKGLGLLCLHCGEPFERNEPGIVTYCCYEDGCWASVARHRECELRQVIGSVGHLRGECSCFGGTHEDPPEMTVREAARAAAALWEAQTLTRSE